MFAENHEFAAAVADNPVNEFKSDTNESVLLGNHKRELLSAQDSSQYGLKPLTLIVEGGADVLDDVGFGEAVSHRLDLSLEVWLLRRRRHSAVADDSGLGLDGRSEVGIDIEPTLPTGRSVGANAPFICIFSECVCMES